jgi:bacterioferritin
MKGNPQVIEQLQKALRDELTAINQYFVHAEMCHNWGYHALGGFIKKQSIDEMKHAEALMERLLFLDATPSMETLALTIGQSVRQLIENDLKLELGAVTFYNDSVRISREAGDNASADLFQRLLKDEEGHTDWLETQLLLMEQMGYENYLALQSRGQKD